MGIDWLAEYRARAQWMLNRADLILCLFFAVSISASAQMTPLNYRHYQVTRSFLPLVLKNCRQHIHIMNLALASGLKSNGLTSGIFAVTWCLSARHVRSGKQCQLVEIMKTGELLDGPIDMMKSEVRDDLCWRRQIVGWQPVEVVCSSNLNRESPREFKSSMENYVLSFEENE